VLGGATLADALARLRAGGLIATPQDPAVATYAPRLTKEDGRIRWDEPTDVIARRVRAFTPWPSAYTGFRGRTVKIVEARPARPGAGTAAPPGTITATGAVLTVATGAGALEVSRLQPEGKAAMSAAAFAAGARLARGDRFE
jgi:methionyl-tRNA formyltransferase